MDMISEQSPIKEIVPIKDRINTSSATEIAGFYDEIIAKNSLDPNLDPYELLKITASNLPAKIDNSTYKGALKAIVDEDEKIKLVGKKAFQFLSLRTVLTVVDSNFNEEKDFKEDREEMLMSAMISVIENAPKIKQNPLVSNQVNVFAQKGIFSYFCEKYELPLPDFIRELGKSGISFIRKIAELKDKESLTNKEVENLAQEWSSKTGIRMPELLDYLTRDMRFFIDKQENNPLERIEEEDRKKALKKTTKKVFDETFVDNEGDYRHRSEQQRSVLEQIYGILDDGIERTEREVAEGFHTSPQNISIIKGEAIRRLEYSPRRKELKRHY